MREVAGPAVRLLALLTSWIDRPSPEVLPVAAGEGHRIRELQKAVGRRNHWDDDRVETGQMEAILALQAGGSRQRHSVSLDATFSLFRLGTTVQ